MATLVYTKFQPEHPNILVTFKVLGCKPDIIERIKLVSNMSYQKNISSFTCPLDLSRTIVHRFEFQIQYLNGIDKEIKKFESRADIEVSYLSSTKRLLISFNTKRFGSYPSTSMFESATYVDGGRGFTIAALESVKIEKFHTIYYSGASIHFDPYVADMIQKEISRKTDMVDFSRAEDDPTIPDDVLNLVPKPYQKAGARFALECFKRDYNPMVALDMGLGKTLVANLVIKLLRETNPKLKTLWISKASLGFNLEAEIRKLTGDEAMRLLGTTPSKSQAMSMLQGEYKHYIISYEIINRFVEEVVLDTNGNPKYDIKGNVISITMQPWVELLNMMGFNICVMDEVHNIKNIASGRSIACRNIKIPKKILLTGTPVVNRPKELYPLLNVLMSDRYNNELRFVEVYSNGKNGVKNAAKLRDELLPIMFRRAKAEVEKDLPPIIIQEHNVDISGDALKRYKAALLDVFITKHGVELSITSFLAQMIRCRQIVADAKCAQTVELAYIAEEETEKKVLIFSKFKSSMHEIAQTLNCQYIDDSVDQFTRMKYVEQFQNDPKVRFLVLSSAIGGEGWNLTAAHTVIFNDLEWTPKDHDQAIARAWGRLSDMHGCNVMYVLANNTIDATVLSLLDEKRQTIAQTTDGINSHVSSDASISAKLFTMLKNNTF